MNNKSTRRMDIDFLKGLSILVVVIYHLGFLKSGYLGVDVFFVIAGFLTVPKVVKQITDQQFSYIKFIWNRIIRFLPAVVLGSILCLVIGLFFWLPDDYENLAQSVIASTAFSNNILSAITTKNYWNSLNDYKPLMHLWYLGILMQFYIVFPLITLLLKNISSVCKKNSKTMILWGYWVISILSFVLFLLPNISTGNRFYMLPFRFYELMFGGIVGLMVTGKESTNPNLCKWISYGTLFALVGILFIGVFTFDPSSIGVATVIIGGESQTSELLLPNVVLVPLTVLLTCVLMYTSASNRLFDKTRVLPFLGKRSYSIFIWHQILLALYRYSISSTITARFMIGYLIILCIISELSYRIIELKITARQSIITVICAFAVCAFSGVIYIRAGVVRDVPELGIYVDDVHRGMHAEYCDRIYSYDKDFETTDKLKVLIIGNSFARDFGNILLESEYDDIELSYSFDFKDSLIDRIGQADRIFVFAARDSIPDYLWANVKSEDIVYGIGTKNFGKLNGQIYFNRFKNSYFEQTVALDPGYKAVNEKLKSQWGNHYIDMMEIVESNGEIRIFTDTNMYISQDALHLTVAGAQYYSKMLNLEELLF
ncbi:MAG: acyltransferase [Ruminococcus sp.]|nr:acyltransferase [Ruminococcus sp.]